LPKVEISAQRSRAGKANPELMMARPDYFKTVFVNDRLNRRHG
jgi:hypothetical protein